MIPPSLRTWFIIHFALDLLFAIPLFVAPRFVLELSGWSSVDPVAARLVAAALFGIGIQSFIGRNEGPEAFKAMLNLKVIWSASATLGIFISLLEGAPILAWLLLAIFLAFNLVWTYFAIALRGLVPKTKKKRGPGR